MAEPERFDPRATFGVDSMPRPLDALPPALARHYPPELRDAGTTAFVLLSVDIDETGRVRQAKALRRLQLPGVRGRAVLQNDRTGEVGWLPDSDPLPHPALRETAERAVREIRFHPAERDGAPVPFWDMRISIQVAPPAEAPPTPE
jgi:hypothetical protein